jgi:uncharacterized protein (TIGR03083 family)
VPLRTVCVGFGCTVADVPVDRPAVANLAAVWTALADLLDGLDDQSWDLPTDCPGWTVKDHVSHLVGIESVLAGEPAPEPVDAPHVRNPLGAANEGWIAERRSWPPGRVLDEFRRVTAGRLVVLGALSDDEWQAPTQSPVGQMRFEDLMDIRIMDSWVHEQDIRRAVGRPGDLDGPVAAAAVGRFTRSLGYVVGKRAAAPEGATVVVRLVGPHDADLAVKVTGGRAEAVTAPEHPDVRLTMTAETYCCLSCGRWPTERVLADGRVRVDGDADLAGRIVLAMSIVP